MKVKAYLNIPKKDFEKLKENGFVELYEVFKTNTRKNKRCDDCGAYCPCTYYDGYCLRNEILVYGNDTCEDFH